LEPSIHSWRHLGHLDIGYDDWGVRRTDSLALGTKG
jgi:hypothetical protein